MLFQGHAHVSYSSLTCINLSISPVCHLWEFQGGTAAYLRCICCGNASIWISIPSQLRECREGWSAEIVSSLQISKCLVLDLMFCRKNVCWPELDFFKVPPPSWWFRADCLDQRFSAASRPAKDCNLPLRLPKTWQTGEVNLSHARLQIVLVVPRSHLFGVPCAGGRGKSSSWREVAWLIPWEKNALWAVDDWV